MASTQCSQMRARFFWHTVLANARTFFVMDGGWPVTSQIPTCMTRTGNSQIIMKASNAGSHLIVMSSEPPFASHLTTVHSGACIPTSQETYLSSGQRTPVFRQLAPIRIIPLALVTANKGRMLEKGEHRSQMRALTFLQPP